MPLGRDKPFLKITHISLKIGHRENEKNFRTRCLDVQHTPVWLESSQRLRNVPIPHPDDPICVYIFRPNFTSILKILHFYLTGMFWDLLTWTLGLYLTSSGTAGILK
jgi:hypothetical protein